MIDQELVCPTLTTSEQALSVGYEEGCLLRKNGGPPEQLTEQRVLNHELPYPFKRGPGSPFYAAWRRGFDAGYLGGRGVVRAVAS
jgi:hypothetical protein